MLQSIQQINPASPSHYQHHGLSSVPFHLQDRNNMSSWGRVSIKEQLSKLEYDILMKSPQLDHQTLTSKLFHAGQNGEGQLYRRINSKRASKSALKALCPNIFIQKLRIIYFLLLTETYDPLYRPNAQSASRPTSSAYGVTVQSDKHHTSQFHIKQSKSMDGTLSNHNPYSSNIQEKEYIFKAALDTLRVMFYEETEVSAVKRKFMAQFFQFLQYDFEQLRSSKAKRNHQQSYQNNKNKSSNSSNNNQVGINCQSQEAQGGAYENIVLNLLNKYPILDQIFIDMLILFIGRNTKQLSQQNGGTIDDNYNIAMFNRDKLMLPTTFTSNWQFDVNGINVVIGTDMFSLDYQAHGYLCEILQCLEQNGVKYGLDVSRVGGFDQHVFKRLDDSFIDDLDDCMTVSNCSQSHSAAKEIDLMHQQQTNLKQIIRVSKNLSQKQSSVNKQITGLHRVESVPYNHPISIMRAGEMPNMKKINSNRSLETIIPVTITKKDTENVKNITNTNKNQTKIANTAVVSNNTTNTTSHPSQQHKQDRQDKQQKPVQIVQGVTSHEVKVVQTATNNITYPISINSSQSPRINRVVTLGAETTKTDKNNTTISNNINQDKSRQQDKQKQQETVRHEYKKMNTIQPSSRIIYRVVDRTSSISSLQSSPVNSPSRKNTINAQLNAIDNNKNDVSVTKTDNKVTVNEIKLNLNNNNNNNNSSNNNPVVSNAASTNQSNSVLNSQTHLASKDTVSQSKQSINANIVHDAQKSSKPNSPIYTSNDNNNLKQISLPLTCVNLKFAQNNTQTSQKSVSPAYLSHLQQQTQNQAAPLYSMQNYKASEHNKPSQTKYQTINNNVDHRIRHNVSANTNISGNNNYTHNNNNVNTTQALKQNPDQNTNRPINMNMNINIDKRQRSTTNHQYTNTNTNTNKTFNPQEYLRVGRSNDTKQHITSNTNVHEVHKNQINSTISIDNNNSYVPYNKSQVGRSLPVINIQDKDKVQSDNNVHADRPSLQPSKPNSVKLLLQQPKSPQPVLTSQRYSSTAHFDATDKPDLVKKTSHIRLPPPYVRYQPKKTTEISSNVTNAKVQRITLDQKKSQIQANKNLIKQLYDEKSPTLSRNQAQFPTHTVQVFNHHVQPQSQRNYVPEKVEDNQKGIGQNVRQKITQGSNKKTINQSDRKPQTAIKQQQNKQDNYFRAQPNRQLQVPKSKNNDPTKTMKSSLNQNKSEASQKSFVQVCTDINNILQNLKVTLKKNEDLLSAGLEDPVKKTEGQQMWDRHKLKISYDTVSIKKNSSMANKSQQPSKNEISFNQINRFPEFANNPISSQHIGRNRRGMMPINLHDAHSRPKNSNNGSFPSQHYNYENPSNINENINSIKFKATTGLNSQGASTEKYKNAMNFNINVDNVKNDKDARINSQRVRELMKNANKIQSVPFQINNNVLPAKQKPFCVPQNMKTDPSQNNSIYYFNPNNQKRPQHQQKKFQTNSSVPSFTSRTPSFSFNAVNGPSPYTWNKI